MNNTKKNSAFGPKQIGMIIFTGVLMLLSSCFVGGQTNTVLPALSEARGWDNQLLNVVSGLASLLDGIGIIIFSRLARRNTKKMAGIALIVMAVALVLFGQVKNLPAFFVLMFVMGAASGCFSSTCSMILTSNWWPTKKGVVLGFSTMGVILMQVVYAPVMPKAYAAIGVGNTQIVLAVLTVIVAIIAFAFVKDTPEEAGTTPDGMEGLELEETKRLIQEIHDYKSPYTLGKLAKDPSSWTMALCTGLPLMVAMTFIASTIPALLSFGYDYGFATFVFAIGGIAALAGSFIFGVIDQKIGTKKATFIYIICMFVAVFAAMNMSKSTACVWVAAIILMAANGSARNLIPSFVGTRFGRWDYPAAYSLIGTIAMLGGGLGIMITGLFNSYTKMYIFDIVILVIALVCCIATKDKFIGKKDIGMEAIQK